jgi:hypothetical protein
METSVRVGWAREQYAKDRYDVEVSLADLPLILTEHGIDPEQIDRIPYTRRLTIIRLTAEVHASDVYLRREVAAAGWKSGQPVPDAVAQVKTRRDSFKAQLAGVLNDYRPAQAPEPAEA